jgi:hypothetical protein
VLRKPTQYACHFDSFSKAESMGRAMKRRGGQMPKTGVPTVDGPGRRARADSVKEKDGVGSFPGLHQVRALAAMLQDAESARALVLQSPRGDQPRPVVAAEAIAYADH